MQQLLAPLPATATGSLGQLSSVPSIEQGRVREFEVPAPQNTSEMLYRPNCLCANGRTWGAPYGCVLGLAIATVTRCT